MITLKIPTVKDIIAMFVIKKITKHMPKLPKTNRCSFYNGTGYILWTNTQLRIVKRLILTEAYRRSKNKVYLESIKIPHCQGIAGKYLNDNYNDLYSIWSRLMNIRNLREYGQPYYAHHPQEARGECLNKKITGGHDE